MRTETLIETLAVEGGTKRRRMGAVWLIAVGAAIVMAAAVFFITLGPRPDFMEAATTIRFVAKFLYTGALAATGIVVLRHLARPGQAASLPVLWLAPALLGLAVILELVALPTETWAMTAQGKNSMVCLTFIPVIGLGPLFIFLAGLRAGAPTRPTLAGAVAGLAAGGLAALFYAAQCTDDSPLFVAVWYPLAIATLVGIGALIGRFALRW